MCIRVCSEDAVNGVFIESSLKMITLKTRGKAVDGIGSELCLIVFFHTSSSKSSGFICVEKKNKLDGIEWFIAPIICSTCFGHFYAHHQELETICVLLPPMVCDALVAGCRRSRAGQPAMRSG